MITASLEELVAAKVISQTTFEKVSIAKAYIEKKYSLKHKTESKKKKDWDILNEKINEIDIDDQRREMLKKDFLHKEAEQMRQKRKKMTIYEYEPLSVIGCGAFGEVRVFRNKITKEIVAIKKMKKEEMIRQNQLMHIRTEKEILTVKNPWIINLKASFQDAYYLYLVMDFCVGGDFMNLLIKREIINENDSRFYITEMILAVDVVHKLNCMHRDLKPDNILIDNKGHLKLSNFGLCKISETKMYPLISSLEPIFDQTTFEVISSNKKFELNKLKRKNRITALSLVGTIDYIVISKLYIKKY